MAIRPTDGGDDLAALTEINITPFIDVMLVLLIIFMVAAPLSTVDVPVDLPAARTTPTPREADPVIVTLTAEGGLLLGDTPVVPERLGPEVARAAMGQDDPRIYLAADERVAYGDLMGVMQSLRDAGYGKIGLVSREDAAP